MYENNYKTVTILLVDDDDVDAEGVQRAFKKLKIANPLVRAKHGKECLDILTNNAVKRPYIILLDLNMPVMSGLETLHAIREEPMLTDSIVFILTTSKDDEDKIAAYKAHVAGYIVKSDIEEGFEGLLKMLEHYWRVVELPEKSS